MRKICKYCGKPYDGGRDTSACKDCVKASRQTTLGQRVCKACGEVFVGGPRAWYCPKCRSERKRDQMAAYKRNGAARPLGSVDRCEACGREYIVTGGLQRYCQDCAKDELKKIDRQQSKEWNAAHDYYHTKTLERKKTVAEIPCKVCGKLFIPSNGAKTCSQECKQKLSRGNRERTEKTNKIARNERRRVARQNKINAMSQDEYRAYRDEINQKARENYHKRKKQMAGMGS